MSEPEIIGPGEVYEEPRPGLGPLARIFAVGAITVGVVALAGIVWFAYQQGIRSGAEEAAPVITADSEPIKREPADPGGLDVPHQDKLVFGRLAPGQIQEPVERLLPPPEEPAERTPSPVNDAPPAAAPATAETQVPPAEPARTPAVEPPPAPPAPAVAPPPVPVATAPPPPPPVVESKPPVVAAAPPAPTPPPAAPRATAGDGWRIQLASVSNRDRAEQEWDRMKKTNADLLGSLGLNVQAVKLDRGTFYRIQAGPLADRAAASSLCGKLKGRNQDCLIVAP